MPDPRTEETLKVELTREELRALSREAGGRCVLHHVQLEDEAESFWAVIAHKLDSALERSP